ncbi:MAG TPA: cyclic nucleotide-binding domain-containing protein [Acidobacteriota bacterium]|nr:cyclic nucleotide-binding domain-containing protein [Acidobacteriota bacterium]
MEEKTLFRRIVQHRDRWSSFGSGTGLAWLSEKLSAKELREYDLFKPYSDRFLERISPDVTVASWKKGAVLFEQGSYIDLAFFVAKGEITLSFSAGAGAPAAQPIFDATRTVARHTQGPAPQPQEPPEKTVFSSRTQVQNSNEITFLASLDVDLPPGDLLRLGPGEVFGEIGALNGWPQSVTAQATTDCRLVQVRVPALRRMRERSEALKERLDSVYRKRSLFRQLKVSPLFRSCPDSFLVGLAKKVDLVSCTPEEFVVEEGTPAQALYLVRSGFIKISRKLGEGRQAISYLSKGMTFGEVELLLPEEEEWRSSYSSVGYSELVRIPSKDFKQVVKDFPQIETMLWEQAAARIKENAAGRRDLRSSEFLQFALEKGLVEGNSVLVIDLNHCTRCDDCVRACSETHGGLARFVREGDRYANLLIAKSCYHCQDPVCLIGCPTGAIRRADVGEVVEIREDICIGCSNCAQHCPYDAIIMHDTESTWGEDALPKSLRGQERLLASKCDLCYRSPSGPACVRNCPQGCAYRVGSVDEFRQLLREES